ncbi:MAG: diaminopimelate decarboxylase [Bordetella sp.]|nr:MAG: diaminopimelate decarboxylase [Bordetella sp.]
MFNIPKGYPHFYFNNKTLYAEKVSLEKIAKKLGTPLYVYSLEAIRNSWSVYQEAINNSNSLICYGMKANSNIAILKEFSKLGSGFDIVSGGELLKLISIGATPEKIVFSGVGKQLWEMKLALENNIKCFNIESEEELYVLSDLAISMKKRAPISIRINPDIDAQTHPYISTALKESKFGISIDKAVSTYRIAKKLSGLNIIGIDCHIGSQLTHIEPYLDALNKLIPLIKKLTEEEISIKTLDLGGGLGICYQKEQIISPTTLLENINTCLNYNNLSHLQLILEPGRSLIGNAGILLTTVQYIKSNELENLVIVDAGMNDLLRPALYQAYHGLQPITPREGKFKKYSVAGPICESADFFSKKCELSPIYRDDIIAIESAGAYGMTMSSNYNSRFRASEVIVDKNKYYIVRQRETLKELLQGESVIP